ncbi:MULTISPECIES: hypothetical protein [unclassified Agrococcus]|uniref:hypothetical protein n=1 Tax=unclassified Agrococcus TaxID=2615065 RepID=UPI003623CF3A
MSAGSMPQEVRQVVAYGAVAGAMQLVGAAVLGPVLARETETWVGVVVAASLCVAAAVAIVSTVALQRGSERARRFVAWPADRDAGLLDVGIGGWTRQRLRSRAAVRWFAMRSDVRARASGGPQQRPAR